MRLEVKNARDKVTLMTQTGKDMNQPGTTGTKAQIRKNVNPPEVSKTYTFERCGCTRNLRGSNWEMCQST